MAAELGKVEVVEHLIAARCNIDHRDAVSVAGCFGVMVCGMFALVGGLTVAG